MKSSSAGNSATKRVVVSILNWNDARSTITCVDAVKKSIIPEDTEFRIVVVDNGSDQLDVAELERELEARAVGIVLVPKNLGFAAGHNLVIRQAIQEDTEFVWLLNNDATVACDTLSKLLALIESDSQCGIVSPLIYAKHDNSRMDFVGAVHDWDQLDSRRAVSPEHGLEMQLNDPENFFVYGTAPLIRVAALRDAGALADDLFAYFEDEELGARFSRRGWRSKVAFDTTIYHHQRTDANSERPPYYFYLMARNSLLFYVSQTPTVKRRWIRLRLLSRTLTKAAHLRELGYIDKYNACLLGIWDGLLGRGGAPRLNCAAPSWLRGLSHIFPYRLQAWLG